MAENKKSFILYADQENIFNDLTDEEAGKLIKHIYGYVNDRNPELEDRVLKIAFSPIKMQLKRDLVKYESTKSEKSTSGKLGNLKKWHKDLYEQVISGSLDAENALIIAKHRTATKAIANVANIAVNDTVNVNVTDNVNEIKEIHSLPIKGNEDILFTIEHCLIVALNDNRWVRANKATRSDLEAFNAVLEKRGIYNKNPADYKTHFHNWSKGGKKENFQFQDIEKSPLHTGGKLSEIVKAIRNEQQQSV